MKKRFLLGVSVCNEIVFGVIDVRERENHKLFSASFDLVSPIKETDVPSAEDYYSEMLSGMDKDYLYDRCYYYDCPPSELATCMADECFDVRDYIDCSLYSEVYEIDGENWYFESESCGQHDVRGEMKFYSNKEAFDLLIEIWDRHHLSYIENKEDVQKKIERITELLGDIDEKKYITDFIIENLEENY